MYSHTILGPIELLCLLSIYLSQPLGFQERFVQTRQGALLNHASAYKECLGMSGGTPYGGGSIMRYPLCAQNVALPSSVSGVPPITPSVAPMRTHSSMPQAVTHSGAPFWCPIRAVGAPFVCPTSGLSRFVT